MLVKEIMSTKVEYLAPTDTIKTAAEKMTNDLGFIPVGENDRLIGAITDRDIVIRAVAKGKDTSTPIKEILSEHIRYCFDTDTVDTAADKMQELQIRRLVVLNGDKRMVGIVSLGDIAKLTDDTRLSGETIKAVSEN